MLLPEVVLGEKAIEVPSRPYRLVDFTHFGRRRGARSAPPRGSEHAPRSCVWHPGRSQRPSFHPRSATQKARRRAENDDARRSAISRPQPASVRPCWSRLMTPRTTGVPAKRTAARITATPAREVGLAILGIPDGSFALAAPRAITRRPPEHQRIAGWPAWQDSSRLDQLQQQTAATAPLIIALQTVQALPGASRRATTMPDHGLCKQGVTGSSPVGSTPSQPQVWLGSGVTR
jgi:hypothetical protein